jgi:hypothetical protein
MSAAADSARIETLVSKFGSFKTPIIISLCFLMILKFMATFRDKKYDFDYVF